MSNTWINPKLVLKGRCHGDFSVFWSKLLKHLIRHFSLTSNCSYIFIVHLQCSFILYRSDEFFYRV